MDDHWKKLKRHANRVQITDEMLNHLTGGNGDITAAELAKRSGLAYGLVYNIIHKRVNSISVRHFSKLFGMPLPRHDPQRVDGTYFRKMVDLWLYLNNEEKKSDLYKAFFGSPALKKVDYRIFSGKTRTIDTGLESMMEKKFNDCGIDRRMLVQWIEEYDQYKNEDRIPYSAVRPILLFLRNEVAVNPTFLLNQSFDRYERGELKTVSRSIFERARHLKTVAEEAVRKGERFEVDRLREAIYGEKKGYTLYTRVAEELQFLKQYARKSPKHYLGRGTYMYRIGGCKRIPSWRADIILNDCAAFIQKRTDLSLSKLPKRFRRRLVGTLNWLMLQRAADLLSKSDGIAIEKAILTPSRASGEYKKNDHGFTRFDRVPNTLGMKKPAFDLMVAKNCEIFRKVGTYVQRWYLSNLYLKELAENPNFHLVTTKYERMAGYFSKEKEKKLNQCMF